MNRATGERCLGGLIAAACLFLSPGCSTPQSRIEKNPALFNSVPAGEKEKVRQGKIALGYTPDMVYLAWGKPDRKRDIIDEKSKRTVWVYLSARQAFDGYDFVQVPRRSDNGRVVMCLEQYPRYRTEYYERASVTFTNDKVSRIVE